MIREGGAQREQVCELASYTPLRNEAAASDAIFASLGKSGRTWVRYVMQHYLELRHRLEFTARSRSAQGFSRFGNVFFTEDYFDFFLDEPGEPFVVFAPEMRDRALIVLVRDPRDVVISSYHWTLFHRKALPSDVSLREFVHSEVYGIERSSAFVLRLLETFESHPGPKHLLRYEDCWSEAEHQFSRLLHFLEGDDFSAELAAEAVKRGDFSRMQKQEIDLSKANDTRAFQRIGVKDWDGNLNALKVRKGGVAGYLDEAPWLRDCSDLTQTRALIEILSARS